MIPVSARNSMLSEGRRVSNAGYSIAMKRFYILATLLLTGLLIACVPSLHPFYTKADLVFEAELVGKWSADNASDSWEFKRNGDKAYTLIYTDKNGHAGHFDAHVFKLGDMTLLDLYPDDDTVENLEAPDFYRGHIMPIHTLARIESIGPTLIMSFMQPKWLDEHLSANPDSIPHTRVKDRIVLTGTTKQLQALMKKHGAEEDFFTRPMDLLPE